MGKILRKSDVNDFISNNILNSKYSEVKFLCLISACISSKQMKHLEIIFILAKIYKISSKKIYETILQVYLFCGFPATIESLKIFNEVFTNFKKKHYEFDLNLYINKGQKNCRSIYSGNYDKLLKNFKSLSPDLKDWMIIEGYGKVMGRSGLSLNERELINVALLSTNFYEHQLYSHLKGAVNTNSSIELIKEVINLTLIFNTKSNVKKSIELLNSI